MRKNKSVLTAVILGASLLLAGCNGLGGANSAAYIANEEEIEAAMDEMSDDLGSFEFSLDGRVYAMPVKVEEFLEEGWTFPEDLQKKVDPFPARTEWSLCELVKTDGEEEKLLDGITLINPGYEDRAPKDVYLTSISLERYDQVKLILPKGITWASSIDDVKDAYGKPDKETETGSKETFISTGLRYYFDDGHIKGHVIIGFETQNGNTKMTNVNVSYQEVADHAAPGSAYTGE